MLFNKDFSGKLVNAKGQLWKRQAAIEIIWIIVHNKIMNKRVSEIIKITLPFVMLLCLTLPLRAQFERMTNADWAFVMFIYFFIFVILPVGVCTLPVAAIKRSLLEWLVPVNDPSERIRFKPVWLRTVYEALASVIIMGITLLIYNFSDVVTFQLHALTDERVFKFMMAGAYLLLCLPISFAINFYLIEKFAPSLGGVRRFFTAILFSIFLPVLFVPLFLIIRPLRLR